MSRVASFGWLAFSLLSGFLGAWLTLTPPGASPFPASATASQGAFYSSLAMADVAIIAREPHPIGSRANAAVREHLVSRMTALGLSPRTAPFEKTWRDGTVTQGANLIGSLPGANPGDPALALMAHYDSTEHGPGAGDDASGVAAVLEIVRALKTGERPARDVMVVLTDGEEQGLWGAQQFFATDPAAGRVGFVINLEARGTRGRAMMFETGRRNGETIRAFAASAQRPVSNSLMVLVYEKMPNGTDFTIGKDLGLQGLNFAFLGAVRDYHAATDTADNLDQRSLQDIGAQALSATRRLASGELPDAAPDLAYSDVLGRGIIAYPPWVGWLLIAASMGLLAIGWLAARRRGEARLGETWRGAGLSVAVLLAAGALLYGLDLGLGAVGIDRVSRPGLVEGIAVGVAALAALAGAMIGAKLGAGGWTGVIKTGLWAALAVQILAPVAAPVIHWPVLLACAAAAITGLAAPGRWRTAVLVLTASLGIAFLGALAHLAWLALLTPLVFAPVVWLALPLAWPLARGERA